MLLGNESRRSSRSRETVTQEERSGEADIGQEEFLDSDTFASSIRKPRPQTAAPTTSSSSSSATKTPTPTQTRRPQSAAAPKTKLSQEDLERLSRPILKVDLKRIKPGPTPLSKLPPPAPGNEHKRYSSVYPCSNRLLAKRWDDAKRRRHQDKLATMKTYIDNKPPQVQGHLKSAAKKAHMEDQKMSRIERENHILLARMVRQMSTVQGFSGLDADMKVKVTASMPTPSARKKKELLEQIEESNQILMQRVEDRLPHYRQEVWDEERRTNLSYLQRISRFPEGYQHVLQREHVPPPLKGPLHVRLNRSEMLRQQYAVESKLNLDEFGNPKRSASPTKSSSSEDESTEEEGESGRPHKVYLTKAEKLRREYIKALQEGGEKAWRLKHPNFTLDELDIATLDVSSSEDDSKIHQQPNHHHHHTHHPLPVRLNRAQKLRLEEQELRLREQEQIKVPTHLSKIEARINFGQDEARLKEIREEQERDRENLFANANVDESDYEPMFTQVQQEMEELRVASWNQVFHGVCLRSGFRLPDGYPVSIGVLWGSNEEDCAIERWEGLNRILPKVKSRANQLGVELFLRDLKWGVPKSLVDSQMHHDISSQQLESYLKESIGIHYICFLSHKLGQIGILPRHISTNLFDALIQSISEKNEPDLLDLLQRWYRKNDNVVPPAYSLLNISANIPDYGLEINMKGFRAAKAEWLNTKRVLSNCLKEAADQIHNTKEWSDDDFETLTMLRKSRMEVESLRAIQGPTEDAILILRDLEWKGEKTKELIGGYLDWNGDEPDLQAAETLKELKQKLEDWIKDANIIIDEVEFPTGVGLRVQDPDMKRYIIKLTEAITELLENSLQKATDRLHLDPIREEILYHSKLFNESIQSFTGKIRIVNKVCAFFQTRYRFGIPPMVIQGTVGVGAASLLCKGLQKYLNEVIPANITGNGFPSTPLSIVRFVGASPESSNTLTLLRSICRQIKRANANITNSVQSPEVSKDCILDPEYLPSDYSSLCQCFRDCLKTATTERPIFLCLLGLDKISSDDTGSTLSWLPVESNLPHVHIAVSLSQESNISETLKLKTERAHMILSQAKLAVFNELSFSLEIVDIPNCQVELNRWMRSDGVSLTPGQRRNLLLAATSISANGFSSNPFILRQHYLLARRLKSWESYNPTIITDPREAEVKAVEKFFDIAEKQHGKTMVARIARLLTLVRDGLSETALEDLFSLDQDILSDSIAMQIESCPTISPMTPLIPIPRVPSIAIIYLLNTMVKEFELVTRGRGYERGPQLLKWSHELAKDVAKSRYLSDSRTVQAVMEDIASYFNNDWTDPEKKIKDQQSVMSVYLKSIGANGENWKGNLKPYKLLPRHVNLWNLDDGVAYNLRRLRVLPRALVSAQRFRELRKLFEDFTFIEALLETSGVPALIKELAYLIREGRRQAPFMPSECILALKHLILFLRHRAIWISQFESTKPMKPPGLWLQEFVNFPTNTTAVFADPIRMFVEDNLEMVMSPRGGRLEYDASFKPENEVYDPIPFHHTNVQCVAVSMDGKLIVSGASDGTVKVWSASTGEEITCFSHIITNDSIGSAFGSDEPFRLKPSRIGISFVCFSPDRGVISCAHDLDQEPSIRLWSLKSLNSTPKVMAGGHAIGASIVRCEYLPPENRRLMSVGSDFNVVLWEVARCKIIRVYNVTMHEFDFGVHSLTGMMPKPTSANGHQATPSGKKRQSRSGYTQLAACVSTNGMFAYGSTTLTVTDSHWKDVLVRDINVAIDKDRTLKWHRLTSITFSSDNSVVYAASAVAPDDVQILAVERQIIMEKMTQTEEKVDTGKSNPKLTINNMFGGHRTNSIIAAAASATQLNSTSVKTELDLKRAKQSVIRAWNVETGHLKLVIYVEDYITSLAVTYNDLYLLAAGAKGTITGFATSTGHHEFVREGHSAGLLQLTSLPPIPKKRKDDEDSLFYTYNAQFNVSVSRSLSSLSGNNIPSPIQFISLGLDDKFLLWTLDYESPYPGMHPITQCVFNSASDLMITLGGADIIPGSRSPALVRVWELATTVCRAKIEIQAEVNYVNFLSANDTDTKIIVGCKSGLVRVYRVKNSEVVREFWCDAENALNEARLGYPMEWPFSVTGITVLSYALHPHGRHLAVAVGGTEREPSLAITLANPKVDYIPDIEYRNTGKPPQHRKKLVGKEEQEKSADRVLRDVIKVTFWDIEGNCLVVTNAFHFPIFFDSVDYTSVVGPYNTQTFMTRKNQFFLKWSHDGKTLCASDDCEVIKECQVEIKNNHVYGSIPSTGLKFGRKAYGPPVTNGSVQTVIDSKLYIEDSTIDLNVSAATAFSSIVYKKQEHTCIAYGDGIIGLRTVNLDRGGEEMRWYLGQKVFSRDGGDIVGCGYVPNVDSRSSMNLLQKQTKITGVIVSARRNGTVVVQDAPSKEICAVFNAGTPICSMVVVPSSYKTSSCRIVLCKADGSLVVLRYNS